MPNSKENILDALASINKLSDPSKRGQKLVNLIPDLTTPDLLSQALKIVAGISNSGACVFALSKLSPHLSDDQVLEALKIASNINQSKSRAIAITNLSPRLTPNSIQEALKIARELISAKSYHACADFLVAILPQVSPALLQDVLKIAYEIDDSEARENRIHALTVLDEILEKSLDSDYSDDPGYYSRYRAIRNEKIDREFCNVPRARAKVLILLYYCLEGKKRSQVFEKLLETIEEIPAQPCKARSLMAIAPYLPENAAKRVTERAFVIVREIFEDIDRSLQDSDDAWFREQINFLKIQELERQLHTLEISTLLSEILTTLEDAEGFLFSDNSMHNWWKPNMIEGLPPVPIPQSRKVSDTEELTRSDTDKSVSNVEENTSPQDLVRYPNLDCPDKAILDQRFSLTIELLIDKPGDQPEPVYGVLTLEDTGTEKLPEVEVVLSHSGFDLEGSNTQIMEVERDYDSSVRFVLVPRKLGQHKIKVQFYQNGKPIGKAVRNILVSEQPVTVEVPQPDQPIDIELKTILTIPPPDLELYIDLADDSRTLSFGLHSVKPEIDYHRTKLGQVTLQGSPLEKMQSVYKEMTQLAQKMPTTAEERAWAEHRLEAVGNELWDELIPDRLKQEYWKFKSRVKSVLITSEEPWIPWEMLKPYRDNDDGEQENDLFWCQHFAISRWLSGAGMADELDIKTARSVAPIQVNLPSVKDELAFLEQLSGLRSNVTPLTAFSTRMQVLDSLKNEDLSVLHFACHGMFDATSPNDSAIKLSDGSLCPSDIKVRFGGKRQRPLIFINACHGGRAEFSFTGLGGWAERMVNARAGAFIGAMWEVSDKLALQFAKTFYTALLKDNKTIAESFRQAREEIRQLAPYNSTWLAYTLYADPEGKVKA